MNKFIGLDYQETNEKLEEIVEQLEKRNDIPTAELNRIIDQLLENYFDVIGEYPKSFTLSRLANVILGEDFRDKDRLKSKKKDYPVLSNTQIRFREKHEKPLPNDKMDFFTMKYTHNMGSAYRTKTMQIEE